MFSFSKPSAPVVGTRNPPTGFKRKIELPPPESPEEKRSRE